MEISQANISNSIVETKTKLTDDLFRLLQVRDKNKDMAKDWLLYLTTSKFNKLTPGEIYKAFQMAISGDLRKENGDMIFFTHELSIITTGIVLDAYLKYKNEDSAYHLAKDKLKQLALPDVRNPSDEQKKNIRERFLQTVFLEVKKEKYSTDAWLLYDDLEHVIDINLKVKQRLFRFQARKYNRELEAELKASPNKKYHKGLLEQYQAKIIQGVKPAVIQNRCKSIVVSNFIKKIQDFEAFKNIINN